MKLPASYKALFSPFLYIRDLAPEYIRIARSIGDKLARLSVECSHFGEALCLFNLSQAYIAEDAEIMGLHLTQGGPRPDFDTLWRPWAHMAARAAVLAARNFGKALSPVQSLLGRVPNWEHSVDRVILKKVARAFAADFPKIDTVRHSVVHPEVYPNPDKKMGTTDIKGTVLEGLYQDGEFLTTVKGGLLGNRYVATFENQVLECDISEQQCHLLVELTRQAFSAFDKIDQSNGEFVPPA